MKIFGASTTLGRLTLFTTIWFLLVLGTLFFSTKKIAYDTIFVSPAYTGPALLQPTAHWDSSYYLDISTKGYDTKGEDASRLAFFPLYPLLIRAVTEVTGNPLVAAAVINWVGTIGAVISLFVIARALLHEESKAWRTVTLFLFFPSAYFLTAVYSEALFCALTFGTFAAALSKRWWLAVILAALASATRLPGVVVAICLVIEFFSQASLSRPRFLKGVGILALASSGLVFYLLYITLRFGSPFILHDVYARFWPSRVISWDIFRTVWHWLGALHHAVRINHYEEVVDILLPVGGWLLATGVTFLAIYRHKLPPSLFFYCILNLLLFALTTSYDSINRYLLTLFPLYIYLVDDFLHKEEWYGLYTGMTACLMGALLVAYANNYWTG